MLVNTLDLGFPNIIKIPHFVLYVIMIKYVLFYLTENSSVFDVRFETVDLAITADLMDPNSAEFQRRQTLFCNDVSGDISIRTRHK